MDYNLLKKLCPYTDRFKYFEENDSIIYNSTNGFLPVETSLLFNDFIGPVIIQEAIEYINKHYTKIEMLQDSYCIYSVNINFNNRFKTKYPKRYDFHVNPKYPKPEKLYNSPIEAKEACLIDILKELDK